MVYVNVTPNAEVVYLKTPRVKLGIVRYESKFLSFHSSHSIILISKNYSRRRGVFSR